jgi:DNA repair photolyase
MDAAIPVDAKNAPTGIWKTAQNAVSHERPHPSSLMHEEERRKTNPALINLSTDSDQVQRINADGRGVTPRV